MKEVIYFLFLGSKITVEDDCNLEIERCLLLGRKSMANLVKMKVTQLCLTLHDPMDYIVHGILHARLLEWVAFPFSRYDKPRQHIKKQRHHCPNKSPSSQSYDCLVVRYIYEVGP